MFSAMIGNSDIPDWYAINTDMYFVLFVPMQFILDLNNHAPNK